MDGNDHWFFKFTDLKPGDIGEDTISLTVHDNDSWACANVKITENLDNSCTEPELDDDEDCNEDQNTAGELPEYLSFVWWPDDGDNVLETDEVDLVFFKYGKLSDMLVDNEMKLTLADKTLNFFDKTAPGTPLKGETPYYIGKGWCFGDMTLQAVPDKDDDDVDINTNPVERKATGFVCSGLNTNNAAQTDSITADVSFYAVQTRHYAEFVCPDSFR